MENSVYSIWGTSFFPKIIVPDQRLMQAAPPSRTMNSSVYNVLISGAPPSLLRMTASYHSPGKTTFNILPVFSGKAPGPGRAGLPVL